MGADRVVQLFGVAIVVLLAGITLLVLQRSAADGRTRSPRGERQERHAGSSTAERGSNNPKKT
jgi:hypothetical protein